MNIRKLRTRTPFASCLLILGLTTAGFGACNIDSSRSTPPVRTDHRQGLTPVDEGEYLFAASGCFFCHGFEGRGGVHNPNYSNINPNQENQTTPALNVYAAGFRIEEQEELDAVVALVLNRGDNERAVVQELFGDRLTGTIEQQIADLRRIIREGKPDMPALVDDTDPQRPIQMPTWEGQLEAPEIDMIIAYLLTQG